MKDLYIDIIDRVVKETGCDWDYVSNRFDEALKQGIKSVDFFDCIVDEFIF